MSTTTSQTNGYIHGEKFNKGKGNGNQKVSENRNIQNWSRNDAEIFNKVVMSFEGEKPLDMLFYLQNKETIGKLENLGFVNIVEGKIIPTEEGADYFHNKQYNEPIREEVTPWYKFKESKNGDLVGITVKPGLLAIHIIQEERVVTFWDTLESFLYQVGVYIQADPVLMKKIQEHIPIDWFKKGYKTETIDAIKSLTGVDRQFILERIDKNKKYINLKNGLFNLETWRLEEHRPDVISFSQVPVPYVSDAQCPKFEKFLHEVLDEEEDILTVQEFFGYTLLEGYPYKKALILYGEGNTGKTTLINVLGGILGERNIASETIQTLTENRFRLAELFGKMANLCPDHPGGNLPNSGVFKAITGNDYVSAEKKGKDTFHFRNNAKIIFSANELPKARDTSDAFYSRFIIISFSHVFSGKEAIKELDKKLVGEEAEGILIWLLKGLRRLVDNDEFSISPSTEKIREEYIRKSNPISAFFMDCIEEEEEEVIIKSVLYSAYIDYCHENKLPTLPENIFGKEIVQQSGFIQSKRKQLEGVQQHVWVNISLKSEGLPRSTKDNVATNRDINQTNGKKTRANKDNARLARVNSSPTHKKKNSNIYTDVQKAALGEVKHKSSGSRGVEPGNPGIDKNLSDKQHKLTEKVYQKLKELSQEKPISQKRLQEELGIKEYEILNKILEHLQKENRAEEDRIIGKWRAI